MNPHIAIPDDPDRARRRKQFRIRTMLLGIAVLAVWLGALRMPGVGMFILGGLGAVALVLALLAALMALAWLGFGLFALVDRAVAWGRRVGTWPEAGEEWPMPNDR